MNLGVDSNIQSIALGHMITLCFTFWGTTGLLHFTFPLMVCQGFHFSTLLLTLAYLYFFCQPS